MDFSKLLENKPLLFGIAGGAAVIVILIVIIIVLAVGGGGNNKIQAPCWWRTFNC